MDRCIYGGSYETFAGASCVNPQIGRNAVQANL